MQTTTSDSTRLLSASLEEMPLIGILRSCPPKLAPLVGQVVFQSGMSTIEVSLDRESGLEVLAELRTAFPQHCIGAGSVLNAEQVQTALNAGANYVVSPIVSDDVIAECNQASVPCIAGAATPTEIARAVDLGAFAVKVFPAAQLGGPGFITSMMAPLRSPRLIAIGGVTKADGRAYLVAGAYAVGVGSGLFPENALLEGRLEEIGARASRFVELLR